MCGQRCSVDGHHHSNDDRFCTAMKTARNKKVEPHDVAVPHPTQSQLIAQKESVHPTSHTHTGTHRVASCLVGDVTP